MRPARRYGVVRFGAYVAMALIGPLLAGCGGPDEGGARVLIHTDPEQGALVIIGSRQYGETPVTLTNMQPGTYYAILSMYGYKRKTQAFTFPESGEVTVTVKMQEIVGYLTLNSNPPGAQIYFDGTNRIGETPLVSAAVPIGAYEYTLRKDNYLSLTGRLDIEEDRRYSRTHNLPPMKGDVQIFSRPSGSVIYVNDQPRRRTTPASLQLPPGVYTIGAYQKGYVMAEKTVEVEPNGSYSVDLRLEKGNMPPGMVLIPAGPFLFGVDGGAPDERPMSEIEVHAFYIDKFEVTNREFAEIFPSHNFDRRFADYPVSGVTWIQASEYATAVGKRLPKEVEWEKAARGIDGREYPWGNKFDPAKANLYRGVNSRIERVGSRRAGASPFGVMDMAGNTLEWTSDWYQPYKGNTDVTVDYGQVFRVLRGGSYRSERFEVRAPRRHYDKVENVREDYGFRCVMDIDGG